MFIAITASLQEEGATRKMNAADKTTVSHLKGEEISYNILINNANVIQ